MNLVHKIKAIQYFCHGLGKDLTKKETTNTYHYLLDRHGPCVLKLDEEEVAEWIIDAINDTQGE